MSKDTAVPAVPPSATGQPAAPSLVRFAVRMVRRRAEDRLLDASLTAAEVDRAVRAKAAVFGRMTSPELAAKLLLDLDNTEFYSDMR